MSCVRCVLRSVFVSCLLKYFSTVFFSQEYFFSFIAITGKKFAIVIGLQNDFKQESPPVCPQEAYCLPHSKYSPCYSLLGRGGGGKRG